MISGPKNSKCIMMDWRVLLYLPHNLLDFLLILLSVQPSLDGNTHMLSCSHGSQSTCFIKCKALGKFKYHPFWNPSLECVEVEGEICWILNNATKSRKTSLPLMSWRMSSASRASGITFLLYPGGILKFTFSQWLQKHLRTARQSYCGCEQSAVNWR